MYSLYNRITLKFISIFYITRCWSVNSWLFKFWITKCIFAYDAVYMKENDIDRNTMHGIVCCHDSPVGEALSIISALSLFACSLIDRWFQMACPQWLCLNCTSLCIRDSIAARVFTVMDQSAISSGLFWEQPKFWCLFRGLLVFWIRCTLESDL